MKRISQQYTHCDSVIIKERTASSRPFFYGSIGGVFGSAYPT